MFAWRASSSRSGRVQTDVSQIKKKENVDKKEFIATVNYYGCYRHRMDEEATMLPMQGGELFIEWKKGVVTTFPENDRPGAFSNRVWELYTLYFVHRGSENLIDWGLDYNMVGEPIADAIAVLREAGFTIRKGEDVIEEYLKNRK